MNSRSLISAHGGFIDPSKICIDTSCAPCLADLVGTDGTALNDEDKLRKFNDELILLKRVIESSNSFFIRTIKHLQEHVKEYGPDHLLRQMYLHKLSTTEQLKPVVQTKPRFLQPTQKPARTNSRNLRPNTPEKVRTNLNANMLWDKLDHFFAALPSDADLQAIFSQVNKLKELQQKEIPKPKEHWSVRFQSIVEKTNGRALMPPGPPPAPTDISEFWKTTRPAFQIEKVQKQNCGVFHHLLNSMVVIDEPLPERERTQTPSVRAHALLPTISNHSYLCYSFEERLNMELESLGLNDPVVQDGLIERPFQKEIDECIRVLTDEVIPSVTKMQETVMQRMPDFREAEKKRLARQAAANKMKAGFSAKKRSRN